jgi:hypothetical protein
MGTTDALSTPEIQDELSSLLGFVREDTRSLTIHRRGREPRGYWELCERSAGSFIRLLTTITEEQRCAIREDAIKELNPCPYGSVRMIGETLIAARIKAS